MALKKLEAPHYPIIYVRGYAGNEAAVEETVATPYMGFNLGSTKVRQRWNGELVRHIFESPLVRLMKDFEYRDIYLDGDLIALNKPVAPRSVVIYRYYDEVSSELGKGKRPEIEVFAEGLAELIEQLRQQVALGGYDPKSFRVYLLAHSMGGLICRALLQNPKIGKAATKKSVDKVFTHATPHNGIDVRILGNVPGFFTRNNMDNFNRSRMKEYLGLPKTAERVDSLNGKYDPKRFFSLVGTNSRDYEVASGWSRRVVGPMSDGLVRIANATVERTPRAFVHRSHSGHYGIVNSEEGYQNLVRFLFGNVRIDGVLRVEEITLPAKIQKALDKGKKVRASYHFETVVRPRGARYDLHRRTVDEGSAIHRRFDELFPRGSSTKQRAPYLFSVFLCRKFCTRRSKRASLVFAVDIAVLVPEYEVDGFLMFDDHIEGSDLYRETLILAATPPETEKDPWTVRYGFNAQATNPTPKKADAKRVGGKVVYEIPLRSRTRRPGLTATLELRAEAWG